MSKPTRIALVGATGLIGTSLIRLRLGRSDLFRIIGIARREVPLPPGARMELLVADPSGWADAIAAANADVLVCALGTTWRKAGKDEAAFRSVDQDLVLACGKAAKAAGIRQMIVDLLGRCRCGVEELLPARQGRGRTGAGQARAHPARRAAPRPAARPPRGAAPSGKAGDARQPAGRPAAARPVSQVPLDQGRNDGPGDHRPDPRESSGPVRVRARCDPAGSAEGLSKSSSERGGARSAEGPVALLQRFGWTIATDPPSRLWRATSPFREDSLACN